MADIIGKGVNRVYIDPDDKDEVKMDKKRRDIKELIYRGEIRKRNIKGVSRGREREIQFFFGIFYIRIIFQSFFTRKPALMLYSTSKLEGNIIVHRLAYIS